MQSLKKFVSAHASAKCYQHSQSTASFYEITPHGATKGNQLSAICKELNQPVSKLITIGDNENDISLLKASPYSFAVANATDEAKSAARFITCSRGDTESAFPEIIDTMEQIIKKGDYNG